MFGHQNMQEENLTTVAIYWVRHQRCKFSRLIAELVMTVINADDDMHSNRHFDTHRYQARAPVASIFMGKDSTNFK